MGFLKSSIYFCWHTIMGKLKEERSGSVRRLTYARLPAWWLAGRWRKTASRGAEKDFWVEERAMMGASRRGASAVPDSRNVRVAARASNKKRAYGWMDPLWATARRRLDHNAHARWVEGFTFSMRRFFSEFIENEIRTEFRRNSSKTDRVATLNSKKRNSHFSTEFRWFLGEIRWFLTEKHIYPMEK